MAKKTLRANLLLRGGDSSKVNPSEVTVGDPEGKTPEGDSPDQNMLVAQSDEPIDSAISTNAATVAMIGNKEFSSIQEALDHQAMTRAVGDPIVLVADVIESFTVANDTSLNLNGHTLTGDGASAITCSTADVNITITGKASDSDTKGVIQADEGYRAITIASTKDAGGSLTLNNVRLLGNGGGIGKEPTVRFNAGAMGIKQYQAGGIIYIQNTKINATSCEFLNGIAAKGYGLSNEGLGGAIAMLPSTNAASKANCSMIFSGCTFFENGANSGAAVCLRASTPQTANLRIPMTFSNCEVKGNKLSPAIYADLSNNSDKSPLNVQIKDNCKFSDNTAGGVYIMCADLVAAISNSSFIGNSRPSVSNQPQNGSSVDIRGGTTNSEIKITNCDFKNNETSGSGTIYFAGTKTATLESCEFDDNVSNREGGALYSSNSNTTVKNCKFVSNHTNYGSNGGGAIYATGDNTPLTIEGSEFIENSAVKANGGAVYLNGSALVKNSTFKENNSLYRGGAIYAKSNSLIIDSSVITENVANLKNTGINGTNVTAGGIHFEPKSSGALLKAMEGTHIYDNATPNEYSGLTVVNRGASAEVFVQDTSTKVTTVEGLEGLETVDKGIQYTITKYQNDKITNTKAKCYQRFYSKVAEPVLIYLDPAGHCKHLQSDKAKVFTNLQEAFDAASAEADKQIIICSTVSVTDADDSCLNLEDGASMKYVRCSENFTGAMFSVDGDVTFRNVILDGLQVEAESAMVQVNRNSNVKLDKGTVFKNANRRVTTNGDRWTQGGAAVEMAYGNGVNKLTINGAEIADNTCTGDGGAIWSWNSEIDIIDGTFSRNTAGRWGGFLNADWDSKLIINGGTFSNNIARKEGGALALWGVGGHGTTTSITGGLFDGNVSKLAWTDAAQYYAGGAIYNDRFCTLNLRDIIVYNNDTLDHEHSYAGEAAVANCPWADFAIFEQHGALVYDNKNQGDVSWVTNGQSTGTGTVSDVALGGGDCNWKGIDLFATGTSFNIDQSRYQGTHSSFNIVSNPSQDTIDLAWQQENKVIFTNNKSYLQGSAIMNNGTMQIGADMKALRITKTWEDKGGNTLDAADIPESIEVTLAYVNDEGQITPVGEETRKDYKKTLTADSNWTAFWTDLGPDTEWTIVENDMLGYNWEVISQDSAQEGPLLIDQKKLTNTWNDERTNISTEKIWQDSDNLYQIRPESIEVKLAIDVDGNGVLSEEELKADTTKIVNIKPNEEGVWRWEFADLPKYTKKGEEIKYLISESPVEGYKGDLKPVQATDAQGEILVDNEGDPVYTWKDADGKEWSAYNLINSLDLVDLAFQKNYEGWTYKDANGNGSSTAVFRVTGAFNGNEFYNNIVSADFVGEGSQQIELKQLLVGATYTIQELEFDGSGYVVVGNPQTFMLTQEYLDNLAENNVVATFNNNSRNEETPNQGVINRYTFSQNGTNVEQIRQQQAA